MDRPTTQEEDNKFEKEKPGKQEQQDDAVEAITGIMHARDKDPDSC